MAARFSISAGRNRKLYFNLTGPNGEVILASQGYESRQGARKGIASVRANSRDPARFVSKTSSNGKRYFGLKARNGQVIGQSQMYKSDRSCSKGIRSVRKYAGRAKLVE